MPAASTVLAQLDDDLVAQAGAVHQHGPTGRAGEVAPSGQAHDLPVVVEVDDRRRRGRAESRHRAHLAADRVHEPGPDRGPDLVDVERVTRSARPSAPGRPRSTGGSWRCTPGGGRSRCARTWRAGGRRAASTPRVRHRRRSSPRFRSSPRRLAESGYRKRKSLGSAHASTTARARSVAPAPPSAKCVHTATRAPIASASRRITSCSDGWSLGEGVDRHDRASRRGARRSRSACAG